MRVIFFWIPGASVCSGCGIITETNIRNGATMRPTEFSADTIIALLRTQTIATLPEVMAALGPRASRRTAFRKLKDLDARTSYSHRGGYYTLDPLADFDEHGLWSFAGVRFSRAGTLIATAESFVNHAEAGHFVDELDNLLAVGTGDPLRKLVGDGRLTRHKLAGQFLYCAADRAHQMFNVNYFCRLAMIIFAGSGLAARWPCRTGIVTRSEACRASRRRPELGGVAAKAAASLAASFPSRTPVSGPQRHCPRSTTGAREGEPQASRCRSRVSVPSVDPNVTAPGLRPGAREGEPQASRCRSRVRVSVSGPQRHCPRSTTGGPGGRAARRVDAVPASAFAVAASRRSCETFLGCRVRVVCDRARSRCQGRQPRAAGAERSDAP